MSHNFQICPIDFALHGDNDPYDIFAFKITDVNKLIGIDLCSAFHIFSHHKLFLD